MSMKNLEATKLKTLQKSPSTYASVPSKIAHSADESGQVGGAQVIVTARKDGDGEDEVAGDGSAVVEEVHRKAEEILAIELLLLYLEKGIELLIRLPCF